MGRLEVMRHRRDSTREGFGIQRAMYRKHLREEGGSDLSGLQPGRPLPASIGQERERERDYEQFENFVRKRDEGDEKETGRGDTE